MARKRVERQHDARLAEHPKEEHERRLARARAIMAELGFDAWIFARNVSVFYMTGSRFCFVRRDGPVALSPQTTAIVTQDADIYCQRFGPFDRDEVGLDTTWSAQQEHYDSELELTGILADYGISQGSTIGIEWGPGLCTGINPLRFAQLQDKLRRDLTSDFVDSSAATSRLMAVKSPLEVERMTIAVHAASRALNRVLEEISIGQNATEVSRTLHRYMMDEGADGLSHAQVAYEGDDSMRFSSCDPLDQEIGKGWIHMDVGCKYRRYGSDINRGVFLGVTPTADELALHACRRGVNDLLESLIKPGTEVDAVVDAGSRYVEEKGFALGRIAGQPFLGHSIGMENYVGPNLIPTSGQRALTAAGGRNLVFEPGMLFALECSVKYPDDRPCAFFNVEDNIVVTENGCTCLSAEVSRDLLVK